MRTVKFKYADAFGVITNQDEARLTLRLAQERNMYAVRSHGPLVTLAIPHPPQVFQRSMQSAALARSAAEKLPGLCENFDLDPVNALRAAEEYAQAAWTWALRKARWRLPT